MCIVRHKFNFSVLINLALCHHAYMTHQPHYDISCLIEDTEHTLAQGWDLQSVIRLISDKVTARKMQYWNHAHICQYCHKYVCACVIFCPDWRQYSSGLRFLQPNKGMGTRFVYYGTGFTLLLQFFCSWQDSPSVNCCMFATNAKSLRENHNVELTELNSVMTKVFKHTRKNSISALELQRQLASVTFQRQCVIVKIN